MNPFVGTAYLTAVAHCSPGRLDHSPRARSEKQPKNQALQSITIFETKCNDQKDASNELQHAGLNRYTSPLRSHLARSLSASYSCISRCKREHPDPYPNLQNQTPGPESDALIAFKPCNYCFGRAPGIFLAESLYRRVECGQPVSKCIGGNGKSTHTFC
jgi:hypothetical protein